MSASPKRMNDDLISALKTLADSVIYQNDLGDTRKKIDYNLASKFVDIQAAPKIVLYDANSNEVGEAVFSHLEYFENFFEHFFSLTYKLKKGVITKNGIAYCVGKENGAAMDKFLITKNLEPFVPTKKKHKHLHILNEVHMSYVSQTDSAQLVLLSGKIKKKPNKDKPFRSVVYESGATDKVLFEVDTNFVLSSLIVTPIVYNQKHVLFCKMDVPDAPLFDFIILIWDGSQYTMSGNEVGF